MTKLLVRLLLFFILVSLAVKVYTVMSKHSLLDSVRTIKTSADVRQIAVAVETYRVLEHRHPPDCRVDAAGFWAFMGEYVRSRWSHDVTLDAWNNHFGFQIDRTKGVYYVYSCGPDRTINTPDDIYVEQPLI